MMSAAGMGMQIHRVNPATEGNDMKERDVWKDAEKGKEEDYFMKKHREWLEKRKNEKAEPDSKTRKANNELACPRCKKPLSGKKLSGINLFQCGTCEGAWLDEKNLKAFLNTTDQKDE